MSPFSLLPSVAFVGFIMVSFLQIGLSECGSSVCVLSFLPFVYSLFILYMVFKVIPWFCIAHSLLRITLRHPIWRKRKFPARLATTKGAFAGAFPCTKQVEEKT